MVLGKSACQMVSRQTPRNNQGSCRTAKDESRHYPATAHDAQPAAEDAVSCIAAEIKKWRADLVRPILRERLEIERLSADSRSGGGKRDLASGHRCLRDHAITSSWRLGHDVWAADLISARPALIGNPGPPPPMAPADQMRMRSAHS